MALVLKLQLEEEKKEDVTTAGNEPRQTDILVCQNQSALKLNSSSEQQTASEGSNMHGTVLLVNQSGVKYSDRHCHAHC